MPISLTTERLDTRGNYEHMQVCLVWITPVLLGRYLNDFVDLIVWVFCTHYHVPFLSSKELEFMAKYSCMWTFAVKPTKYYFLLPLPPPMFIILFYFTIIYILLFSVLLSTLKGKHQGPATFCLNYHGQVLDTEDACYMPERSKHVVL